MTVKDLANDNYIVLKMLYDNQATVLNDKQIPLTQLDVAKELGFSKNKVNSIFKMLQEKGYIEPNQRGKYKLTDRAEYIVENIEKIQKKIEEA